MKIRGNYFGRLFSLLFIMLGIWFIGGFVNYSNSFQYFDISLDKTPSYGNSNYEIGVLKRGDFITNYLNTSKGVFAYTDKFFIWWFGGSLYWYDYTSTFSPYSEYKNLQGFVQYYRSCDSLFSTGDALTNCSALQEYDYYDDFITNYMSSLTYGDLVYFDYSWEYKTCGYQCHYYKYHGNLCFSHSGFNSSLCFYVSEMNRYLTAYPSEAPLKDSLSLPDNLTISSIPYSYIGRSPGNTGLGTGEYVGSSDGNLTGTVDSSITGDYVYSYCTYGDIIDFMEQFGYNKNVCYGGLDNFNDYDSSLTYSPIPGTGLRLSQILSYSTAWDTPNDWFMFWNGLYKDRYNNSYNAMWESYPAVYRTWFDLYYQYGGNDLVFDSVREYCNITVDLNLSRSLKYTGTYFRNTCSEIISNGGGGGTGPGNGGGYDDVDEGGHPISVNRNGVGNITGTKVKSNITFLQDFFNLTKSVVPTNFSGLGGGFLPNYIVVFLIALIIFRFLSH